MRLLKNKKKDKNYTSSIITQVDRWDIYARVTPTLFLIISIILISTGVINFDQAFYIGIGLFAVTAVTWWFWTIYTIRHLVKTLDSASTGLQEIKEEFKIVDKEIRAIRNEQQ